MKHRVVVKCLLLAVLTFLIRGTCLAGSVLKNYQNDLVSQWAREKTSNKIIDKAQNNFVNGLYSETIINLDGILSSKPPKSKKEKALIYVGLASSYIEENVRNIKYNENKEYYYKAISYFNDALKLAGKTDLLNISVYSGLGFAYFRLQRYHNAMFYLQLGLRYPLGNFKKEHVDIYTNLGYVCLGLNKYKEAAQCFNRAIKIMGGSFFDRLIGVSISNYTTNIAQISSIFEKYKEISYYFDQIGEFIPEDFDKFQVCVGGIVLYEELKKYIQSSRFTQAIITHRNKSNEEGVDMHIRLGYLALGLKRYQEAIGYFNQGLGLVTEDYQIFTLNLGLVTCYHELSDDINAVSFLRKGMEYFEGRTGLGYLILNLKQYEQASEYFKQILKLSVEDPLRLKLMSHLNEYLQSQHLKQISDFSPVKYNIAQREVDIILGNIAFDFKLYQVAIGHFNRALKCSTEDSNTSFIYLMLGSSYRELKDYNQAISYLDKGLSSPIVN
ncbi:MAG: tetratricopeptide repeat protein [Candidatus Omnitrophota bacterium]